MCMCVRRGSILTETSHWLDMVSEAGEVFPSGNWFILRHPTLEARIE